MKFPLSDFPIEEPFEFRSRLESIHPQAIGNPRRPLQPGEFSITEEWQILLQEAASEFLQRAAGDLQQFFENALKLNLQIVSQKTARPVIRLSTADSPDAAVSRSFLFNASPEEIQICGDDERGCAAGVYFLEDLLNLRENPFLAPVCNLRKEPLFSPRIIHSGYGRMTFTDAYLNKAAHCGFDSIILYTNMEDQIDFQEIFRLAEKHGLDIYFYSKFPNPFHPSDPQAAGYYRKTYGELFRRYPRARGIMFVGESMYFPSRDPHVRPKDSQDFTRPQPASWPCSDYKDLLQAVKKAIDEAAPGKDVICWTYNWGNAPEEDRIRLIESLPQDIALNVNFALHDRIKVGNTVECPLDYSIGCAGPSHIFQVEGAAAARRGLKLFTMSNTAGRTWDVGVIPYMPALHQWLQRFQGLIQCHEQYHLQGLLESHSYGWQPSVVTELAKWMFWTNAPEPADIIHRLAVRHSSGEAAADLEKCWLNWSRGTAGYPTPIEDQYGPCRVGPAYPFFFSPDMLPTYYGKMADYPDLGQNIVFPWFRPVETPGKTTGAVWRVPEEIRYLQDRIKAWTDGVNAAVQALEKSSPAKKDALLREIALGCFITNTLITTRNVKRWWLINTRLMTEENPLEAEKMLDQLLQILEEEKVNVLNTIPAVRCNSALGFECNMNYPGDEKHLRWKLHLLEQIEKIDIPGYRQILKERENLHE